MYRVFCLFKQYMTDSKERSKEINTFLIYLCEMKHFTKKKNKHLALINQALLLKKSFTFSFLVSQFLLFFFRPFLAERVQEGPGAGGEGAGLIWCWSWRDTWAAEGQKSQSDTEPGKLKTHRFLKGVSGLIWTGVPTVVFTEGVPQRSGEGDCGERHGAECWCAGDAKSQESLTDPEPGLCHRIKVNGSSFSDILFL